MSLQLNMDRKTSPAGMEVRIQGLPPAMKGVVEIRTPKGAIDIGYRDLLTMTFYALTNTDLGPSEHDPRLEFVRAIKRMKRIPGFDSTKRGSKRLHGPFPKMM